MKNLSSNNNNKGTSTNNNNKKEREQHELIGSVSVPFQIPEAQSPVNTAQRDGCYQHRGTSKESKATSKLNTFTTHIFHTDHKITTFISSTKKKANRNQYNRKARTVPASLVPISTSVLGTIIAPTPSQIDKQTYKNINQNPQHTQPSTSNTQSSQKIK
jgi:hypothetical protein